MLELFFHENNHSTRYRRKAIKKVIKYHKTPKITIMTKEIKANQVEKK